MTTDQYDPPIDDTEPDHPWAGSSDGHNCDQCPPYSIWRCAPDRHRPSSPRDVTLDVVVNGWRYPITVTDETTLDQVVANALARGNHTGRPASDFEVRDAAGLLLDEQGQHSIRDLKLTAGGDGRLYLNLRAGAGG